MRLSGRIALVTAAGAGIGRATALAFAAEGAHVHATDIDETALKTLTEPNIRTSRLDVRDETAVTEFFGRLDRCDILFNCAGIVPNGTVLDSDVATFANAWDLNVLSMVRTIRASLPGMLAKKHGTIVNMSSVASSITGVPNRAAYGTTKAAVIGLTKSIAADFVRQGIRCNAICPGTVDTPSLQGRLAAQPDPAAALQSFLARQPMGRFGKAEEIAALAVYLASDDAAFVTGQTFTIDGGWTT
ncbi:MAG: SDR family oxidoreductase [Alphaproteobacteria bacterium]|nr:SDR family oxidoreductase [Alphaproteobacteria bacterium]MBL6937266.1 SDR family oxidoreductase [Alphaproteobacteria bacterium]MBL7096172.1 SDR family oxidoreductase [Alphaproteobacteria bacterium]